MDRDERKWGKSLFGRWIYSPDVLQDYSDVTVCIAVENSAKIREYIQGFGIKRIESYVLHPEDDKVPCIIYESEKTTQDFFNEYRHRFCIAFFVDDNKACLGHRFFGMGVYSPELMRQFPGMAVVDAMDGEISPK